MTRFFMRSSVSTLMKERSQEEPVSPSRSNLHKFWERPDHSCFQKHVEMATRSYSTAALSNAGFVCADDNWAGLLFG
eukprot:CAMPEP_0194495552 /NCGR_PEP_ID=MMETSP0253-20130528/13117_1 /TAXON_ID=2966 /ORGANISM="Noctiluca scintillans" /LENGTH=76 /DNA_ID=CAMNT_0039336831 /DNA_START=162 /DNA_END=395 /DNA_ORIENTATION=+